MARAKSKAAPKKRAPQKPPKAKKAPDQPQDPSKPLKNAKHEDFCNQYVIDSNGKQAAIRAGYSPKTAENQASRVLSNAKVAARVAYLQDMKNARACKSADDIRERLEDIAFTDITDIVTFNESGATFIRSSEDIDPRHAAAIESIGYKEDNVGVSFKLKKLSPYKALELLGKEEGMFVDKVEHSLGSELEGRLTAALKREMKDVGE